MKYLKKFESILYNESDYSEDDIQKGDYALFYYDKLAEYAYHARLTPELKTFINDNIGIINIVSAKQNTWIEVIYENIPDNIKFKFDSYGRILLQKDALKYFARTKEELEQKISAKKFNL